MTVLNSPEKKLPNPVILSCWPESAESKPSGKFVLGYGLSVLLCTYKCVDYLCNIFWQIYNIHGNVLVGGGGWGGGGGS